MATLNLNAEQLKNSNIGIVLSNMVYNLNNAVEAGLPSLIQVGSALPSGVTDLAGSRTGYSAILPNVSVSNFQTTKVLGGANSLPSGLDAFIATDASSNTAVIALAGLNGALGLNPRSAADTTQAAQLEYGAIKDFVLKGGLVSRHARLAA